MLTLKIKIKNLVRLNIVLLLIFFSACAEKKEEIKTEQSVPEVPAIRNILVETINASNLRFRNPKFSEDGIKLFFISTVKSGLWMHDLKNDTTFNLNDKSISAGNYTSDKFSTSVIFIHSTYDKAEKKRKFFVGKQEIGADSIVNLYSSDRRLNQIELTADDNVAFFDRDSLIVIDKNNGILYNWDKTKVNILRAQRNSIIEYSSGRMNRYGVLEKGNVIWPQYVRDNDYLYNGSGKGTFLYNRSTGISKQIGDFTSPNYNQKNNLLVYIKEKNDGQRITSSRIYIANIYEEFELPVDSKNNYVEENPDWSPDGKQIVYNTVEGKINIASLEFIE